MNIIIIMRKMRYERTVSKSEEIQLAIEETDGWSEQLRLVRTEEQGLNEPAQKEDGQMQTEGHEEADEKWVQI